MTAEESERVPIVIPTYNAVGHLRRCMKSLSLHTVVQHRIYIADDHSPSPELHSYLNELEETKRAVVFRSDVRRGFAGINNWAVKQIPFSDYICLLNSDIIAEQSWLIYMVQELEADSRVALVGALLIFPKPRGSQSEGVIQHAGVARNASGAPYHPFRGKVASFPPAHKRRKVNAVTGACMLIRRGVWERLKGFDEGFVGGQFEDVDFCWRVRKTDRLIIYQPKAILIHHEHGSGLEWVTKFTDRNFRRLIDKWGRRDSDEYRFR